MTNDIRQSLDRLQQLAPACLHETSEELTTLIAALRADVNAQSNVLQDADTTHAAYSVAASDVVALLQLTQTAIEAKTELGKLSAAASKTMQKLWKKVPK